jgi:hypothetical protein
MSLEIGSLNELDSAKVAAMVSTLTQLVQERHPEVELTRGVFHDLVLYFNGILNAAVRENVDRVLQSKSLLQITQNPALADTALVDQVLSNFNLARDAGTPATGLMSFVLVNLVMTRITPNTTFIANNFRFKTAQTYTIVTSEAAVVTDTDRAMRAVGDGTYTVTLPVVATAVGAAGNIKRGTIARADATPDNVLQIYAASDFVEGRDPSTNEDYLKKLATGLTAKTIGGRKSYEALIRNQNEFANLLHMSVLGCGDPEQQRDQHSLFPISGGGKIDVYVQTNSSAQEQDHLVTATFIGNTTNGTLWQTILPRDVAPGFYDITRVLPPQKLSENTPIVTSGGYRIVEDIRDISTINAAYIPDMQYTPEAAYTRYQTAVIRFEDTDKLPTGLIANSSTANYTLTTRSMPFVSDIHDFLTSRENRARATDILVKAAVPCFTRISFAVHIDANDIISDATVLEMKRAVVAAIANVGFSGQLHASLISGAAHKFLTGRQAVNDIDMFGQIRRPDGTIAYLRDNVLLTIPFDPARMVTGRTTAFLTGLDDVEITPMTAGFAN